MESCPGRQLVYLVVSQGASILFSQVMEDRLLQFWGTNCGSLLFLYRHPTIGYCRGVHTIGRMMGSTGSTGTFGLGEMFSPR